MAHDISTHPEIGGEHPHHSHRLMWLALVFALASLVAWFGYRGREKAVREQAEAALERREYLRKAEATKDPAEAQYYRGLAGHLEQWEHSTTPNWGWAAFLLWFGAAVAVGSVAYFVSVVAAKTCKVKAAAHNLETTAEPARGPDSEWTPMQATGS